MTITRFVEYDPAGELLHVCTVETTEGHMPAPAFDAPAADRAAHRERVAAAVAARVAETRAQLQAAAAAGARLLVLPDSADAPEPDRHYVKAGKLTRRTDAQLAQHRAQRDAARPAAP